MKIEKEKYSIYAIIMLLFGLLFFIIFKYLNYLNILELLKDPGFILVPTGEKYDTIWFKIAAIGFGMISCYFSFNSKPFIQRKLRVLLISISLLLISISMLTSPNF